MVRPRTLLFLALLGLAAALVAPAGAGTSLSQMRAKDLREACNAGDAPSCTELQRRVDNVSAKGNQRGLLCLFYRPVAAQTGTANDLAHLTTLMGPDAPPGIADALIVLAGGQGVFTNDPAEALATLTGYTDPICAFASQRGKTLIRSDNAIGSFKTKVPKGGTLGDARAAFGPPDTVKRRDPLCTVRWKALGLRMFFANLGGDNSCADDTGFFTNALTTNKNWRTANGLAAGQRLRVLRQKFPNARRGPKQGGRTEWWLVTRRELPALGGGRSPHLLALVKRGRIVAFEVRQSNAGE